MRHYAKALLVTLQSASSVAVGSGVSRLNECRLRISLRWHCDTLLGFRRIAQRLRHAWSRHVGEQALREAEVLRGQPLFCTGPRNLKRECLGIAMNGLETASSGAPSGIRRLILLWMASRRG